MTPPESAAPADESRLARALAVIEVVAVLVGTHVSYKALKQLAAWGEVERAAKLNLAPGVIMATVALLGVWLHGRGRASWGFQRWWPSRGLKIWTALALTYAATLAIHLCRHSGGPRVGAIQFLQLILVVSVGEELLFRGYFQSRLNEAFGKPWQWRGVAVGPGLLIAAGLFGVMHAFNTVDYFHGRFTFAWAWGVATIPLGVCYGFVRERHGSLIPAVLVHGLWDVAVLSAWMLIRG